VYVYAGSHSGRIQERASEEERKQIIAKPEATDKKIHSRQMRVQVLLVDK
jgi:hypothetical protein